MVAFLVGISITCTATAAFIGYKRFKESIERIEKKYDIVPKERIKPRSFLETLYIIGGVLFLITPGTNLISFFWFLNDTNKSFDDVSKKVIKRDNTLIMKEPQFIRRDYQETQQETEMGGNSSMGYNRNPRIIEEPLTRAENYPVQRVSTPGTSINMRNTTFNGESRVIGNYYEQPATRSQNNPNKDPRIIIRSINPRQYYDNTK